MGVIQYIHELSMGKVGENAHPLHPITVHYPITFLLTSYTLDLLHPSTRFGLLPRALTTLLPATTTIANISYYTNIAGLISLVPASITGSHELYEIWVNKGTRREKKIEQGVVVQDYNERALKAGYLHAAMNGGIEIISIYAWLSRRQAINRVPTTPQALISGLGIGLLIYSSYMGGELVYKYGIGVQRQGEALDEKREQWKDAAVKKDL